MVSSLEELDFFLGINYSIFMVSGLEELHCMYIITVALSVLKIKSVLNSCPAILGPYSPICSRVFQRTTLPW